MGETSSIADDKIKSIVPITRKYEIKEQEEGSENKADFRLISSLNSHYVSGYQKEADMSVGDYRFISSLVSHYLSGLNITSSEKVERGNFETSSITDDINSIVPINEEC